MDNTYTESDWKLFRKRIAGWQEAYTGRLNREYVAILSGDGMPSDRFWALEKRVNTDKHAAGVFVEMRRSRLVRNLVQLLSEGAICEDDLEGFSDGLRASVMYLQHD